MKWWSFGARMGWLLAVVATTALPSQRLSECSANPWAQLEKLPVTAWPEQGVELLVRDLDGMPAQADVYVFAAGKSDPDAFRMMGVNFGERAYLRAAARNATRYRSDRDGRVVVTRRGVGVFAIGAGTFCEYCPWRYAKVLNVHEHLRVRVEAIDEHGRPVPHLPLQLKGAGMRDPLRSSTDARGRCEMRVARSRMRDPIQPLFVTAGVVREQPVRCVVPIDESGGDPRMVRLALPACGQIEVHTTDRGQPVPAHVSLSAGARRRLDPTDQVRGVAYYPFVALGEPLQLSVQTGKRYIEQPVEALAERGQTRRIDVRADAQVLKLSGRIVDERGTPVDDESWICMVSVARGGKRTWLGTGADGRFAIDLDLGSWPVGPVTLHLVPSGRELADGLMLGHGSGWSRIEIAVDNARRPAVAARFSPPDSWQLDLGDVEFRTPEELLRGVVVDDAGQPIPGVDLAAATGRLNPSRYAARTDAKGRFAIYDWFPRAGKLSFRLRSAAHECWGEQSATVGEQARFVLRRRCSLEASIADASLGQMLTARLGDGFPRRQGATGYRFERLAVGKQAFELLLAGRRVLRIADVDIEHGVNKPEQLQGIEWRRNVRVASLHATRADGSGDIVNVRVMGDEGRSRPVSTRRDGRRSVPYLEGQLLVVHDEQYCTQIVAPAGQVAVPLVPRPHLELRPPAGKLLPAGLQVKFDGDDVVKDWAQGAPIRLRPHERGEVLVQVRARNALGRWQVLHEQLVKLPDQPLVVATLDISQQALEEAERLAGLRAARERARLGR